MAPLHLLLLPQRHAVVPQIIKTEFRVRAVGDVAGILLAAHARRLVMQNHPHRQAQKTIDRSHPFRITRRQVIIDRHHMHSATG